MIILSYLDLMKKHEPFKKHHITYASDIEDKELFSLKNSVEAIFCDAGILTGSYISSFPNLKWVQIASSGYDSADIKALKDNNILFTNAKGVYSIPIAEDIFCKMLMFARKSIDSVLNKQQAEWQRDDYGLFEVYGRTMGILGTGSIAAETAKRAKAFNMNVLGYNRSGKNEKYFDEIYTGKALDVLVKTSDVIVCTLPYSPKTEKLVNDRFLDMMKSSAVFINVARGRIVDEKALINALKQNKIAGAGLDVFENEPLPKESPLWKAGNVIITPHTAGLSDKINKRLVGLFEDNLNAYLSNGEMLNEVEL